MFFCVSGGPFGLEPVMRSGAGMGLLLIILTPIFWAIPCALMTAELASALPEEGGYYVWTKRAFGPFGGFLCGWWTWLYSWVDIAIYPTLFASAIHELIRHLGYSSAIDTNPWVKWLVGMSVIIPFTWLNISGTRRVGQTSVGFFVFLLIPFVLLVGLGIAKVGLGSPGPMLPPGQTAVAAIGSGLFVVMWNYLGWDSLSTIAGEVRNPRTAFPKALLIAMPVVTLTYLLPAWVGIRLLPDLSQWEEGAWTRVIATVGGNGLVVAMTVAAVISAAGLYSATLLGSSRIPFVLAQDGFLPHRLVQLHPKTGTPVAAILLSAGITSVLSFTTFENLAIMDVTLYSAAILIEFAALIWLRKREPELPRPFMIPGGIPVAVAVLVVPAVVVGFGWISQLQAEGRNFLVLSAVALLSGPIVYSIRKGATG